MDYRRVTLAAILAGHTRLLFGLAVWMSPVGDELLNSSTLLRPMPFVRDNVPLMLAGWSVASFMLAILFAKLYKGGNAILEGIRFGILMGIFSVGFVSISLYAQFNIAPRIAVIGGIQLFVEMILVGTVIGAAFQPPRKSPARALEAVVA